jgi:hypothetical protein
MYIQRSLLLVFLIMYIFTPSIQSWVTESGTAWYRPYIAWATAIVFAYWIQRRAQKKKHEI